MDENITASMVFVSSFESKSGFAIETCAKRIARLKFGEKNVPTIVNPRNLSHDFDETRISGQIVVTDVDTHNGNLRGEISAFRANNEAKGAGKKRVESGVTQSSIKEHLLPLSEKYRTTEIYSKPVDLAFFDGAEWNLRLAEILIVPTLLQTSKNYLPFMWIWVLRTAKPILLRSTTRTEKETLGKVLLKSIWHILRCS